MLPMGQWRVRPAVPYPTRCCFAVQQRNRFKMRNEQTNRAPQLLPDAPFLAARTSCRPTIGTQMLERVRDHRQETIARIEQFVAREIFVDGETPIGALATVDPKCRHVFKDSGCTGNRGRPCVE